MTAKAKQQMLQHALRGSIMNGLNQATAPSQNIQAGNVSPASISHVAGDVQQSLAKSGKHALSFAEDSLNTFGGQNSQEANLDALDFAERVKQGLETADVSRDADKEAMMQAQQSAQPDVDAAIQEVDKAKEVEQENRRQAQDDAFAPFSEYDQNQQDQNGQDDQEQKDSDESSPQQEASQQQEQSRAEQDQSSRFRRGQIRVIQNKINDYSKEIKTLEKKNKRIRTKLIPFEAAITLLKGSIWLMRTIQLILLALWLAVSLLLIIFIITFPLIFPWSGGIWSVSLACDRVKDLARLQIDGIKKITEPMEKEMQDNEEKINQIRAKIQQEAALMRSIQQQMRRSQPSQTS